MTLDPAYGKQSPAKKRPKRDRTGSPRPPAEAGGSSPPEDTPPGDILESSAASSEQSSMEMARARTVARQELGGGAEATPRVVMLKMHQDPRVAKHDSTDKRRRFGSGKK